MFAIGGSITSDFISDTRMAAWRLALPICYHSSSMKHRLPLLLCLPLLLSAQSPDLRFRLVGPFRAGRVVAVAGVPSQPNVYYFGSVGGGVWKTTDGGGS